jgi:pimeloyl-ACP methyl ester carboxylesterase
VKLVRTVCPDDVVLHGLDNEAVSDVCVAHIHGKCGNFYANAFISIMASAYAEHGIRFVSFNHRGHDCLVENIAPTGEVTYLGGSVVIAESIRQDIVQILRFAEAESERVILQGHSQGCEYVLTNAQRHPQTRECILLSPSDSVAIQRCWREGEPLASQVERLRKKEDLGSIEWMAPEEYGVRGSTPYHIPTSGEALLSVLTSREISAFVFDEPWSHPQLSARCFAYVGGADPLAVHPPTVVRQALERRFAQLELCTPSRGDHAMRGIEAEVVAEIVEWIAASDGVRR